MKRTLFSVVLVALVFTLPGCFDTTKPTETVYIQDTTRTVSIKINPPNNVNVTIYANHSIVAKYPFPADSIIVVPDSSTLIALWYLGSANYTADTIASPGLVWVIR